MLLAKMANETQIAVRVPSLLTSEAKRIVKLLKRSAAHGFASVSVAAVYRLALDRGLRALRVELEREAQQRAAAVLIPIDFVAFHGDAQTVAFMTERTTLSEQVARRAVQVRRLYDAACGGPSAWPTTQLDALRKKHSDLFWDQPHTLDRETTFVAREAGLSLREAVEFLAAWRAELPQRGIDPGPDEHMYRAWATATFPELEPPSTKLKAKLK